MLLSQAGCVGVSAAILEKVSRGAGLEDSEREEFLRHPELGAELLGHIPRLEGVAASVRYQHKHFDGRGFPRDDVRREQIPLVARVLHAVLAFDDLRSAGPSDPVILEELGGRGGELDPQVLAALVDCVRAAGACHEQGQLADKMLVTVRSRPEPVRAAVGCPPGHPGGRAFYRPIVTVLISV